MAPTITNCRSNKRGLKQTADSLAYGDFQVSAQQRDIGKLTDHQWQCAYKKVVAQRNWEQNPQWQLLPVQKHTETQGTEDI